MTSHNSPNTESNSLTQTPDISISEFKLTVKRARDNPEHNHYNKFKLTIINAAHMQCISKEQQLIQHFHVLLMASFVTIVLTFWKMSIFNLSWALINGGQSVLIYSLIWHFADFIPINLSMVEMASMALIAKT